MIDNLQNRTVCTLNAKSHFFEFFFTQNYISSGRKITFGRKILMTILNERKISMIIYIDENIDDNIDDDVNDNANDDINDNVDDDINDNVDDVIASVWKYII